MYTAKNEENLSEMCSLDNVPVSYNRLKIIRNIYFFTQVNTLIEIPISIQIFRQKLTWSLYDPYRQSLRFISLINWGHREN